MTSDELVERLINFAARVGKVVDALPDTRMGRHIGGSIGSQRDFTGAEL